LIKNSENPKIKNISGVIYGSPFFRFPLGGGNAVASMFSNDNVSWGQRFVLNFLCKSSMNENLIMNPALNIGWISSDKSYVRKLIELDGTRAPFVSPNIIRNFDLAMNDIRQNYGKTSNSYLLIIAG